MSQNEALARRDLFLQCLEPLVVKLHDLATFVADQMIVVIGLPGHILVAGLPVVEMPLLGEPTVLEKLDCPVDGSITNARTDLAHLLTEFINTEVAVRGKENLGDVVPLGRRLKALFLERLMKEVRSFLCRTHPGCLNGVVAFVNAGAKKPSGPFSSGLALSHQSLNVFRQRQAAEIAFRQGSHEEVDLYLER